MDSDFFRYKVYWQDQAHLKTGLFLITTTKTFNNNNKLILTAKTIFFSLIWSTNK